MSNYTLTELMEIARNPQGMSVKTMQRVILALLRENVAKNLELKEQIKQVEKSVVGINERVEKLEEHPSFTHFLHYNTKSFIVVIVIIVLALMVLHDLGLTDQLMTMLRLL